MSAASRSLVLAGGPAALLWTLATPAMATGSMMMEGDWFAPLDHYCERVGTGFWAEPLNAFSNGAFLLAAGVIAERQRRSGWSYPALTVLAAMAASVGIGSLLFHTLANGWTLLADVIPIAVFILAFFFVAMRRFFGLGAFAAGLATIALLLLTPALKTIFEPVLGASATYAPGLVATFGVALAVPLFGRGPAPRMLIASALVFAIALVFRVLDQPLCDTIPFGTHFLWHTFNGLAVLLALLAAERAGRATRIEAVVLPGQREAQIATGTMA